MSKEGDGVYISLSDLYLEGQKSRGYDLHFQRLMSLGARGDRRSKIRGRGMDFFESRPYVPQDEIRNIDWKVSARLNELFTKIYTEERDRPVYLAVDMRSSMFFGSTNCFKSVLAARLASRLANAAINGGDRVGGLVFNEDEKNECPIGGRKTLARLFGLIAEGTKARPAPKNSSSWPSVIERITMQPSGSLVFLLSDFYGLDRSHKPLLYRLKKRVDAWAIKIVDPLEKCLPSLGEVAMVYGEEQLIFNSSDEALRKHYEAVRAQHEESLAEIFSGLGIPVMEFSTALDPSLGLKRIFSGR